MKMPDVLKDGDEAKNTVARLRDDHLASFEPVQRMLEHYATGFGYARDIRDVQSGAEIEMLAMPDQSALPVRASIGAGVIKVPPAPLSSDRFAPSRLYQATVAHALAHLRYSRPASPVGKRGALWIAVASLIEDARVERLLMREYPGLHRLWGGFHTACADAGLMSFVSLAARLARALHDPGYDDPNHWIRKGRDLVEDIAGHPDDTAAYDEVASILAVDLAQMRVRFDASAYLIEPAYRDDNAYLWCLDDQPEPAKTEPALTNVADKAALQRDSYDEAADNQASTEAEEVRCYRYPEWHARVGAEFAEWTCVFERAPAEASDHALRSALSRKAPPPWWQAPTQRLRRQLDGDDLDLSALIDDEIARRGRIAGDARVFERKRRKRPGMSVLLLLDLSESTNDRTGMGEPAVLDIEKEAAGRIATALDATSDRIALHGFASNGRHDVRYTRIKDFNEPFGVAARHRLQAQRGALSTRMGAAIRHAATCLDSEVTDAKVLILVTDGEPSDIDVHGSTHLLEDARHAVAGLSSRGILTFCFALDRDAGRYVRTIFGPGRYMVLEHIRNLPVQISRLLGNLVG
jgi:nitric oxide reductase NorD protein